ncbi:unnamed protein product [Vicia faba]|uniref:Uncharacterized protein n=1 Tax=Vicia faba TaxID=3906 RepID=A0AAV0ZHV3_VICFA|nr:unnamed protein product [Vicia faba]
MLLVVMCSAYDFAALLVFIIVVDVIVLLIAAGISGKEVATVDTGLVYSCHDMCLFLVVKYIVYGVPNDVYNVHEFVDSFLRHDNYVVFRPIDKTIISVLPEF